MSLLLATTNMLAWPDYVLIACFLGVNVGIGWWVHRRKRGTGADYFLGGGRVPPWAAGISWYGTQISSVSFMALPAYAYAKNWLPMMVGPIFTLSGIILAVCFVGIIRRLNTSTIFAYLERRFDRNVRLVFAGLAVLLSIFGRSSVIMVLPALALSAATGMNVYLSIALMGLVTTLYATEGGFEAVVWTDVLQVAMMVAGVVLIVWFAAAGVDGGLSGIVREGAQAGKFQFVSWEWNLTEVTVWVMLGYFMSAVFTTLADQALMQRVLAAQDEHGARRTVITGSLLALPSNAIFFFVGTALFAFYQCNPGRLEAGVSNDSIVGYFVARELPSGVVGLIIAGIFAAAMSTLSSSLSAVAAIVTSDFAPILKPQWSESRGVALGRRVTLVSGVFATAMAMWIAHLGAASLWEQAMRLLALFGGALPGAFALGMLTRRANARGVIVGALASISATLWVQNYTSVNSFFHAFVSFATSMAVGYAVSCCRCPPPDRSKLQGLTIWDLAQPAKTS